VVAQYIPFANEQKVARSHVNARMDCGMAIVLKGKHTPHSGAKQLCLCVFTRECIHIAMHLGGRGQPVGHLAMVTPAMQVQVKRAADGSSYTTRHLHMKYISKKQ